MSRVLLLATTTGYQIRSFGEAAERLGVRLLLASDRCDQLDDPWWDQAIPVRFHDVERSIAAVLAACLGGAPDGLLAVGDRPVVLTAHLARRLGLPGHPPAAAEITRNKLLTREALRVAGLPVPEFASLSIDDPIDLVAEMWRYPAVIKPLALSGSRGVMRVDTPDACVAAFERLGRLLRSPDLRVERDTAHDRVLLETFIPGAEYAVEGLLTDGCLRVLAVFDKPDPLDGPFFEETIYVTPSNASEDILTRIEAAVADAARAMGLHHGPVHAECRVHGNIVHVLEVAARPIGGLCSRALRFTRPQTGPRADDGLTCASLEELLLRHACHEDVSGYAREQAASGVMMIPIPRRGIYRGVHGVADAGAVPGVEDIQITAKPDGLLIPLPEGRSYLGFIFARGSTSREVEQTLRVAHGHLRFSIERAVPVTGLS